MDNNNAQVPEILPLSPVPPRSHQKFLHHCPHRPRQEHPGRSPAPDHQHHPLPLTGPVPRQTQSIEGKGNNSAGPNCLHALSFQPQILPHEFGGHPGSHWFPLWSLKVNAGVPGCSPPHRCNSGHPSPNNSKLLAGKEVKFKGDTCIQQNRCFVWYRNNGEGSAIVAEDRGIDQQGKC